MRIETLPSPGVLSNGIKLRVEAAKAIGAVETTAMRTPGGKTSSAGKLAAFFTACAASLSALYEVVAPTISTRVATSATKVTLTFSEPMDQLVAPAVDAFTSAGNTITGFAWISPTVAEVTGTGFAATENFTYTQPLVNGLRDLAGNLVATTSANLT